MAADFDTLRGCGFLGTKIATIKAIAEGAKIGLIPSIKTARMMDDEGLIAKIITIEGARRLGVRLPHGIFGVFRVNAAMFYYHEQIKSRYKKTGKCRIYTGYIISYKL